MTDPAEHIDPEAQAWPIYFGLVNVLAEVLGPEIYKVEAKQLPAWVRARLRAEMKAKL